MNNMLWPYFKNLFLHFLTKKSRYTHQPGKSKYYSLRLKYAAFWKRLNFARTQKEHFSLFDQEKMINKFKIFLLIFPFSNGQVRFESTESTSTETSTMTPFFTMIFFFDLRDCLSDNLYTLKLFKSEKKHFLKQNSKYFNYNFCVF